MTPLELVQGQLEAYNSRDLNAFCSYFTNEVVVFDGPEREIIIQGMGEFRQRYSETFSNEQLFCEIIHRVHLNNIIVDHERTSGLSEQPLEVVVIYKIEDDKIAEVTFF